MNVQIVYHEVPAFGRWVRGDDPLKMGQEISFGSPRSTRGCDELTAYYVACEDERSGPVADVLEFASLDLALA